MTKLWTQDLMFVIGKVFNRSRLFSKTDIEAKEKTMHKKLKDMNPVDDFVARNTRASRSGTRSGAACSAPAASLPRALTFTDILKGKGLEHDLCRG